MPPITHRLEDKGEYTNCPNPSGGPINLTFSGVFDFKYFYYILHEWLVENGYADSDNKFREDLFSQREDSAGREIFVKWRFVKKTGVDPYPKFELDIHIHTLALGTTEVLINNKKTKMDKGEIEIKIDGRLMHNKKFTEHWTVKSKFMEKFGFEGYLKEQHDNTWANFYAEVYQLQEAIKEYFNLTRFSEKRDLLEYYKTRTGE